VQDLLRSLPSNPIARSRTVQAIFEFAADASSMVNTKDVLSVQQMPGCPSMEAREMEARKAVTAAIKDVCDAHGAVVMKSSLVGNAQVSMAKQAPALLVPSGTLLSLRHEMRYAFATWLAAQANIGR
jgi:hypothetical protein